MSNTKATSFHQERFPNALEAFSFETICNKISAKDPLCSADITAIASASLPQLLKCIEIAKTNYSFKPARLKAAFFVPLNKLIADKGSDFAIEATTTLIERMSQTLESKATLYFQIDSWAGATPYEILFETLETILRISSAALHIAVNPPSADELNALWRTTEKSLKQYFSPERFSRLHRIGIETIVGEDQHQILKIAVAHNCNLSIRSKLAHKAPLLHFCETLLQTHEAPYRHSISSWSLQVDDALQLRLDPTTAFRAIAIARLLFTDVDYIGIDATLCDPPLLRLAAQFGANDFGYAGIDSHTASSLNIPTLSEAEKITGIALAYPAVCSYAALKG